MIPFITYVFFGVFLLVSLAEIIFAFNEMEKLRKIFKPLCLLFLGVAAVTIVPQHPLIYVGAFLGMIGDLLLIWNKRRFLFILGTIAFLFGHLLYISEILFVMMKNIQMPLWFYVVVAFSVLLFVIAAYPLSKKITQNRWIALLGNSYLSVLVLVVVVSLISSINGFADYMILGIIGGISFLASDIVLTNSTFIKDFKRRDYYIMLFYLLGQAFIVAGISLTYVL